MEDPLIFLSAGDPSGDCASARLVASLKELNPTLGFFGLGGVRLKDMGQHQLADPHDLAVLGFWEVAKRYGFFRRLFSTCIDEIKTRRPKAVILVDYPGFNLRLAKEIRSLGIPIIYYISPQVWAWGKRRVSDIRKLMDLVLVILPFEQQFFAANGVRSEFVGHYLLEDIPDQYIASPSPRNKPASICLMPGSRPQEIDRMLEPMLEAARLFNRKYSTRAVLAAMKNRYDYGSILQRYKDDNIAVTYDESRKAIWESDLVLTASGTATLETAIIGRPMVVVYKTGFLTYQIARWLVKLDAIALANLVLDEKVVPELIQGEATARRMFEELERLYLNEEYYSDVNGKLNRVPALLGGKGASLRAAELIAEFLQR